MLCHQRAPIWFNFKIVRFRVYEEKLNVGMSSRSYSDFKFTLSICNDMYDEVFTGRTTRWTSHCAAALMMSRWAHGSGCLRTTHRMCKDRASDLLWWRGPARASARPGFLTVHLGILESHLVSLRTLAWLSNFRLWMSGRTPKTERGCLVLDYVLKPFLS